MREIDYRAINAAQNEEELAQLIHQQQFFILKCASTVSKRYITTSDDEWSIALMAFTKAVYGYDEGKGSFYSFAEMIIKRRLIDHYRGQAKYQAEVSVNPKLFEADGNIDEPTSMVIEVGEKLRDKREPGIKEEIEGANQVFAQFGFSFFDLASCSPKAGKTKKSCAKAVAFLLGQPLLVEELYQTRQLPLKIIEKSGKVPRKILERHRKYIIAAVEILSGEYPYLAEYMHAIRKELET